MLRGAIEPENLNGQQRSYHLIAFRKVCAAERTATTKYKHYVRLVGPDGADVPGTRGSGWGYWRSGALRRCLTF
jgi:hypothetical protein